MVTQLESAFSVSIADDKRVLFSIIFLSLLFSHRLRSQTLMTVVQELDRRLIDGYIKPKVAVVGGIVRDGILDPTMDWYETPQPTGIYFRTAQI
jgi:exocyst complex component 2